MKAQTELTAQTELIAKRLDGKIAVSTTGNLAMFGDGISICWCVNTSRLESFALSLTSRP